MAVTNGSGKRNAQLAAALLVQALPALARAATLPEDRADLMYHRYQGGGVTVDGPALLVRTSIADSVSFSADYYVDSVSSASIDVVTTASAYKEKRTETALGVDYLYRDAVLGVSFTRSDESDYRSNTFNFKYAQETFGGMTTVNMGYGVGKDKVLSNTDSTFSDIVNRYSWRLGVAQVLTKSWLFNADYEGISENGYLNSPYRAARVFNTPVPERYPRERSSHALALTSVTHVFSGSAIKVRYRYFNDNWQIHANTIEGTFSTYVGDQWLFDFRLRHYSQNKASFYADDFTQQQNYMARGKELSACTNSSLGVTGTFGLLDQRFGLKRASLIGSWDYVKFDYQDFSDVRTGSAYSFNANIFQLIFSAWY